MMERLARDKHVSLLQKFVNYGKNLYNIGPSCQFIKLFSWFMMIWQNKLERLCMAIF
jgi:hypothetical protein